VTDKQLSPKWTPQRSDKTMSTQTEPTAATETPAPVAYLVDTHVGAMSQIIVCPACYEAGDWAHADADDRQPLDALALREISQAENQPVLGCETCDANVYEDCRPTEARR
jgi:hypothetical protein